MAVAMRMVMPMVVLMVIERERFRGLGSEQGPILGIGGDGGGRPLATDVAIQADDPVRGAHDHMQIMAD